MKAQPLHINIPKPCKQVFDDMPEKDGGRHCNKCEKVIHDFSQMTDGELLLYFKNNRDTHCGRFHVSQMNKNIELLQIRKKPFQQLFRIAASLFALITFKGISAKAQKRTDAERQMIAQFPDYQKRMAADNDSLLIRGTVKDKENKPLVNALVRFDDLKTAVTDENGYYSLILTAPKEPHHIYFSCPNHVREVRTWHPNMKSTDFDIYMGRRDSNAMVYSMGIMVNPFNQFNAEDVPQLEFKGKSAAITVDMKPVLHVVANKLKANPMANVNIIYSSKKQVSLIAVKRAKMVRDYLINEEGISEDRMSLLPDDQIAADHLSFEGN